MMTVATLIAALQQEDPLLPVVIPGQEGSFDDVARLTHQQLVRNFSWPAHSLVPHGQHAAITGTKDRAVPHLVLRRKA